MLTQPVSWLKLIFFAIPIIIISVLANRPQISSPENIPSPEISPSPSPSPSLSPSPTLSPSPSPKPLPSPSPTPSPSPQPQYTQEEIQGFLEKYSNDYHVDINILRYIAICESGFNPNATNLNYKGLFQFSPNTWGEYRNILNEDPDPNLRVNAKEAVKTSAYVLSINHSFIWPNCYPE